MRKKESQEYTTNILHRILCSKSSNKWINLCKECKQ